MIDTTSLLNRLFVLKNRSTRKAKYLRLHKVDFSFCKPGSEKIALSSREVVACRSAVVGIVFCPAEEKILMMRQFRCPVYHATGDFHLSWMYEAVAGCIEITEDPAETLIREVYEETGITISKENITFHTSYYVSPGFTTEKHYIYSATVEKTSEPKRYGGLDEEGEAIISQWLSYDEVANLVEGCTDSSGLFHRIEDGKTLMGLMKLNFA